MSISPIFHEQLFCTKVFCAALMCLQFGFVIFWQKDFGTKAAHKMLAKLTPEDIENVILRFFHCFHLSAVFKNTLLLFKHKFLLQADFRGIKNCDTVFSGNLQNVLFGCSVKVHLCFATFFTKLKLHFYKLFFIENVTLLNIRIVL